MTSVRLRLMRGQLELFHAAVHEFLAELETRSEDYVFLRAEPAEPDECCVYEINCGERRTLESCISHLEAKMLPGLVIAEAS